MAIFCIDASEKEDFVNWKKEHDSELLNKVAEKLKERHYYMETEEGWGGFTVTDKDIDEVIAEMKVEVSENANKP